MSKIIYLGADHAGFKLKEQLKNFFDQQKVEYVDLGNSKFDPKDDYPDFGFKVAEQVAETGAQGILICGSSEGVCIAANKVKGIRAVSVFSLQNAKLVREHNDANILCLSGWELSPAIAKKIVMTFLKTKTSKHPRHARRLKKISAYEIKNLR